MDGITDRNVIVACVAKVGMVGSTLKGNGPVNRAIVKLTTIDDNVEIVNYRVAESAPLKKEFPPSSGKYDKVVENPITEEQKTISIRSYATARFAAIQLANGKGLIDDEDDMDEWEGSDSHPNENRKNPIIWLEDNALLLATADKYAPYGRTMGRAYEGVTTISITRRAALHHSEVTALEFENLGNHPFTGGYLPIFVGEPKRVIEPDGLVAASAKSKREMSEIWLVDTGCGHDLVSLSNAKSAKAELKRLEKPVIFQTANGDTPSTHVAPMFFSELNETIEPYVLAETPSVISVGKRTMNEGCSYVWKAGNNPYMITSDRKVITFGVIRDIPYLIRNSELCQPREATDEDYEVHALPSVRENAADENVVAEEPNGEVEDEPPPIQVLLEDKDDEVEENNPRRNLREEAISMNHLLTHKPFNIYCDACNLGKMRRAKKFVGAYQASRQPTKWLDLVTAAPGSSCCQKWRYGRNHW